MASASRTLTLKLLADINNFTEGLDKSTKQTQTATEQIADFGKKAALAFAAVGAAALAYAKQAVEAAAADEAAQIKLATTIQATTNASTAQIAEVERWITKTSIAIGITDDELRPAFDRLVRSTNNVEQAQKLLNLALDLQAATGKPLETVTNALGKAYDGNTAALGKLGLGIDASTLKSKDFNKIFTELDTTFGNFAEDTADTTQKSIERVKISLDEANESIGMALLPIVQQLTAWIMEHFVPALQAMIGGLTGDRSVLESLDGTYKAFYDWGQRIRGVIDFVVRFKDEILLLAGALAGLFVASKITAGVQAIVAALTVLRTAYITTGIAAAFATAGVSALTALGTLAALGITTAILANIIGGGSGGGNTQIYTGNPNLKTTPTTSGGGASISLPTISGGGITTSGGAKITTPSMTAQEKYDYLTSDLNNPTQAVGAAPFKTPMTISGQVPIQGFAPSYGAGVNTNTLAGIAAASGGGITVNVNGAIDPEGTARTIVNTLNSSFYRGTGGADGLVYAL